MNPFWPWLVAFGLFVAGLVHEGPYEVYAEDGKPYQRSPFSDAHHAYFASILYWMAADFGFPWWALALLILVVLEDALEHWTRGRVAPIKTLYGKLGGTV